jgi:hypothetical protein
MPPPSEATPPINREPPLPTLGAARDRFKLTCPYQKLHRRGRASARLRPALPARRLPEP